LGGEAGGVAGGAKRVSDQFGQIQDIITVTIKGGPRSDTRALFRLAASIAFGKVQRLVPAGGAGNPLPPPGAIAVQYSLEKREVTFMLSLSRSIMTITTVGDGAAAIDALPVFSGPSMTTVGGNWDFLPATAPLAPALKPPNLEFAGKTILTPDDPSPDPDPAGGGAGPLGPTKNHRPSGDARSRGSLVRMVTAALASPAETGPSTFVLPNDGNRFVGG
jgi:hypothetical protein